MTRQFCVKNTPLKYLIVVSAILLVLSSFFVWHEYLSLEPLDISSTWAPDGQQLAFACHRRQRDREWGFLQEYHGPYSGSDSSDWYELCVLDIASGEMTRLTRNTYYDGIPTWSPDGLHIAYMSETMKQHSYDINLLVLDSLNSTTLITGNKRIGQLLWSPTGYQLAFVSSDDSDLHKDLYLLELDTKKTRQLTYMDSVDEFTWNPKGDYIAFTGGDYMEKEVFMISVESRAISQITFDKGYKTSPAWSPDGHLIAFTAGERLAQVYIIDVSTHEVIQLSTDAMSFHQFPAWSPDGNFLAYIRGSLGNNQSTFLEIKALNQDVETRSYEIPDYPILALQWSPDGKYLALNQCADWNHDGWNEFKIWLFDIEQNVFRPSYTTFPWQIAAQSLPNVVNP